MSYEELTLSGFVNEMREVSSGPHPRMIIINMNFTANIMKGVLRKQLTAITIWRN